MAETWKPTDYSHSHLTKEVAALVDDTLRELAGRPYFQEQLSFATLVTDQVREIAAKENAGPEVVDQVQMEAEDTLIALVFAERCLERLVCYDDFLANKVVAQFSDYLRCREAKAFLSKALDHMKPVTEA